MFRDWISVGVDEKSPLLEDTIPDRALTVVKIRV
jgi:hypothetical protein